MAGKFNDKVVIVTGGSRGLGRAMSLGFAAEGARVVVASRKIASCENVVRQIEGLGGEALARSAHMGNLSDIDELIEAAYARFGRVDILVNNAGTNVAFGALSDISPEAFDKMLDVNLKGPWYLASRLAPRMGEQGGGCVINVLSVAALSTPAYSGVYAATKAGLKALTEVMAQEWADWNIRVNALAPGSYHSDLTDGAIETIPGYGEGMVAAALIPRVAETEEILNPVFYLASESFTTGITLVADGGLMAKR
ncbi:SDR family NAD(P)-dependent oxidoreductase [Candidatus Marimicrobium litorale]|jgi:NAD(P)-dependent dehydrogenase (short-subunit alcohol dehydrogenase family)|uniref:Glucose 1-dehydrogenase n=1 Tax=Candidatus Marimicrobium litorale TaxID=2518991 RepID=A0ABT3T7V5_9GAMM|nr:glucose 1-dehydrogenase [Candidatus Marimicrobium litorale]MCX2978358.1 glucose 1-dehydrogenase [Candidatus Marimicrobium litorale]